MLCCGRGWVWAPIESGRRGGWRVLEAGWGRFPLGGGNDEEKGAGMTGGGGVGGLVLLSSRYPCSSQGQAPRQARV